MEITDSLVGKITERNAKKEGKVRAKEHRDRKKAYVKRLEGRVIHKISIIEIKIIQ